MKVTAGAGKGTIIMISYKMKFTLQHVKSPDGDGGTTFWCVSIKTKCTVLISKTKTTIEDPWLAPAVFVDHRAIEDERVRYVLPSHSD